MDTDWSESYRNHCEAECFVTIFAYYNKWRAAIIIQFVSRAYIELVCVICENHGILLLLLSMGIQFYTCIFLFIFFLSFHLSFVSISHVTCTSLYALAGSKIGK